jgi:hypothetical protein
MSWISKAENLLNKIDKSAAIVLQQKDEPHTPLPAIILPAQIPKIQTAKSNGMILTKTASTPKKVSKNDLDMWDSISEKTTSRRSSISSKHDTVIDKSEEHSMQLHESSSTASLNSFSVEKELAATKILASELRSENNELKGELEALMEQVKVNGNSMKIQELEEFCETLMVEKNELSTM